jgi:chromosome segregation ATPase
MESFKFDSTAVLALGGLLLFPLTWLLTRRWRRAPGEEPGAAPRRAPSGRLEALAAAQADLAARLDALAAQAPEERLQAMAGQLVGLIRDKNATLETALAGLDQLRARMRALEQMGEPAEARALMEKLEARLDELAAAQAAGAAALEARLGGLAAPAAAGVAELAERMAKLHERKDAAVEAVLARLGPLEAKLEAAQGAERAVRAELAALRAEAGGPAAALAERMAKLHEQKDAGLAAVLARLAALEAEVTARDPEAALGPLTARLAALEASRENPFAEVSDRLARLYAQKDAAVEAVLARLGPVEAKLAALEGGLGRFDPQAVQERLAALEAAENPLAEVSDRLGRLHAQKDAAVEAVLARIGPLEARLAGIEARDPRAALDRLAERLAALETPGEGPFAELADQLTRLYAQKDAGLEALRERLAPLEAKLAGLEGELGARDPRAALDRLAGRLEAVQERLAVLEAAESPFVEVSDRLTRLHAQKDAAVEAVLARLGPLEAKLGELDPRAALDRFAERLEAVQGRLASLETPGENPFAEIADQLTRLYAQKDAAVETVFARLAPLEAKLAALDPQAALDRFDGRLEAVQGRLAALETPENPFAEISEQLTRLYAQKDAAVEAVLNRLGPLEAKLGELEGGLARLMPLAEDDPRAALDGLRARLGELHWAQGEVAAGLAALQAAGDAASGPLAAVADQLTRLHAQKDAGLEALRERLAPLEARLAELEARAPDPETEAARAEAQGLAAQLIAARAAAEATEGFAGRLARLEAGPPAAAPAPRPAPAPAAAGTEEIWDLPRLVSLHRR